MTTRTPVLIVSTVADVATDSVVQALTSMGIPHHRFNTETFPFDASATIDYQADSDPQLRLGSTSPLSFASIWYRRLRAPPRPEEMDPGVYDFCIREGRAALLGGLLSQDARWMSRPDAVWRAESKPYQLRMAREAGLRIPKTIVSNDPAAVRHAHQTFGPLIIKPVRSGHFLEHGEEYSIFTSPLTDEHMELLHDAKWAPSIYQELVPKKFDIRVTIIGPRICAAAIHSQTDPSASIDWRRTSNAQLPHSIAQLPIGLQKQLRDLMTRLELQFGCIDLILTPDDEYVFLEVNPSGQWLWLDDQLDFGISESIADWLATGRA